jgi:hypothetical protein
VRDSQLLAMRLLYSLDYPVKYFILVVPRQAMQGTHAASLPITLSTQLHKPRVDAHCQQGVAAVLQQVLVGVLVGLLCN